jgi:hypothetical protein
MNKQTLLLGAALSLALAGCSGLVTESAQPENLQSQGQDALIPVSPNDTMPATGLVVDPTLLACYEGLGQPIPYLPGDPTQLPQFQVPGIMTGYYEAPIQESPANCIGGDVGSNCAPLVDTTLLDPGFGGVDTTLWGPDIGPYIYPMIIPDSAVGVVWPDLGPDLTVCGIDSVNYLNSCEAARYGVPAAHPGACSQGTTMCTMEYAPVCGISTPFFDPTIDPYLDTVALANSQTPATDAYMVIAPNQPQFLTFGNRCEMENAGFAFYSEGPCESVVPVCELGDAPVCGSQSICWDAMDTDGSVINYCTPTTTQTFSDRCQMERAGFAFVSEGACVPVVPVCELGDAPVCGSQTTCYDSFDGQGGSSGSIHYCNTSNTTFSNRCEMQAAGYREVHDSYCDTIDPATCNSGNTPVCAREPVNCPPGALCALPLPSYFENICMARLAGATEEVPLDQCTHIAPLGTI